MTIVDDLASRASEVFGTGIPWSSFEQEPEQDVYGKVQYYVALAQEMRAIFEWSEEVSWTWDVVNLPENPKALVAWGGVQNGIISKTSIISAALSAGKERIGAGEAPQLDKEILRAFFSQMFSLAMRGYNIHHNLILQHSNVAGHTIVNNADMVFYTMRALNRLHSLGAFEGLKKTSVGVGAITPAVAAVIAIGSVAALICIAWFVTKMTAIMAQWELANTACLAAINSPNNPELAKACQKAQEGLQKLESRGDPVGKPLNTLAVFGGLGILVVAFGYGVLPALQKRK